MSATCPAGHRSATADYCDQCGARIDAPPAHAPKEGAAPADTSATPVTSASRASPPCPQCGTPRTGHDRFCETCGFDLAQSAAPPPSGASPSGPADTSPSVWAAEVAPDLAYFERVAPEALTFPHAEAARTIALDATRIRIGRRSRPGEDAPEIELDDPAVSRLHATLVHAPDGAWAIVDERSSNGTTLNDDNDPIPPHLEVPLREGDRVHVGAWTTITLALRSRAA
jgi:FHA domain